MTTHLVTFATPDMNRAAELCLVSARENGVLMATGMSQEKMRSFAFYEDNQALLDQPKGAGYWAWKPWLIFGMMSGFAPDDSILIYSDAGVEFIDKVTHIIDRMDQDIFLFGNMFEHAHWCKQDIIDEVWPARIRDWSQFNGKQAQASVIFFRVSDYTRKFVKEWLDWCLFEGGRLIDDSPSRSPNHPEFQENRHDQAILTTMAYREGIKLHWWPAVYNRFVPGGPVFTYERGSYPDEGYPVLFHHHRLRNHEWSVAA